MFIGEGRYEYNLDALTDIEITESFLTLDQESRECQNDETFSNCTTRHYMNAVLQKCGCLPFNMRLSNRVCIVIPAFMYLKNLFDVFNNFYRILFVLQKTLNVLEMYKLTLNPV